MTNPVYIIYLHPLIIIHYYFSLHDAQFRWYVLSIFTQPLRSGKIWHKVNF